MSEFLVNSKITFTKLFLFCKVKKLSCYFIFYQFNNLKALLVIIIGV